MEDIFHFLPYSLHALPGVILSVHITGTLGLLAGFLVILILLLCSAAISAAEVAYFSLTPTDINSLKTKKSPVHHLVLSHLSKPKQLLAAILIGNNFVNVGTVILSTYLLSGVFDFTAHPVWGFVIQVVLITSLLLLIGEIIPKVLATRKPMSIALFMARPLQLLMKVASPLSAILVGSTGFIDKRMASKKHAISLEDLSDAIDITADGITNEEDRKIMKSIARFGDINAREIMTPRVLVTAVDQGQPFSRILQTVVDSGFSRIPVYDDSPDKVTGVLYIKDLLPYLESDASFEWTSLVRPAFFVPENKPINDLLDEFREKKIHMAVVVDEYGGTSGIITMEDIIEEIIGDISDEFDTETDGVTFNRMDEHTFVFEGRTSLNDVCRLMDIDDPVFEEVRGESDTLAGLVLELSGKMPAAGETFRHGEFTFTVEAADRRRIKRVKVIIGKTEEAE